MTQISPPSLRSRPRQDFAADDGMAMPFLVDARYRAVITPPFAMLSADAADKAYRFTAAHRSPSAFSIFGGVAGDTVAQIGWRGDGLACYMPR